MTSSAISIDLRFGVTNRNYYDQKTYAIALAQATDVDMSLILLQNAVRVTSLTKPAQLPISSSDLFTDQIVTACGLGLENQQYNLVSSYLQYTRLKVLPNYESATIYGSSVVNGNVMCTVGSTDIGNALSSTCSGDSGSPIFATINGITTVVGVVSFGASRCDQGEND
jgi:secreted trypsin-like serine protease